jgi:hypothetical protein
VSEHREQPVSHLLAHAESAQVAVSSDSTPSAEVNASIADILAMDVIETDYQDTFDRPAASEAKREEHPEKIENAGIGHLPDSLTTVQEAEVFFPLDGKWDEAGTFLIGAADTQARTEQAVAGMPNLDLTNTEGGREWVEYMRESMTIAPKKDQWRAAVVEALQNR